MRKSSFFRSVQTFAIASGLLLNACSKSPSSDSAKTPETPSRTVSRAEAALTVSQAWCSVDSVSKDQFLASRYQFYINLKKQKTLFIDRLLIDGEKKSLRTYQGKQSYGWFFEGESSSSLESAYAITSTDDSARFTPHSDYSLQRQIFEKNLRGSPALSAKTEFDPKSGLKLSIVRAGAAQEKWLFPCESYGGTFTKSPNPGPRLELGLWLSEKRELGSIFQGNRELRAAFALHFPIQEMPLSKDAGRRQWCSWSMVGNRQIRANVLTFGPGRLVLQSYLESKIAEADDQETVEEYLHAQNISAFVSPWRLESNGQITGGGLTLVSIRDTNRREALVSLHSNDPENEIPTAADIYFDCREKNPLGADSALAKNLARILTQQKEKSLIK